MSAELQVQPAGNFIPAPQNFEEAWKIARLLSDSDLVPKDYRGKPANCLVALQWGADLGLPGLQALQNIAVIGGRPSVWGDAALALVQSHRAYLSHREWIRVLAMSALRAARSRARACRSMSLGFPSGMRSGLAFGPRTVRGSSTRSGC